jgi:hypothetical protein
MTLPDCDQWQTAIQQEYDALMKRKTWVLEPLPTGRKVVRCKWVFKKKTNDDGSIARYKARLCAKGFTQQYGLDYSDTISPTVSFSTLRMLFQLAVHYGLDIQQTDVDSAFLYADLQEEIYMEQP